MDRRCYRLVAPALLGALLVIRCAVAEPPASPLATASTIEALVSQPAQLQSLSAHPWDAQGWLERFYAARGHAPAWTGGRAEAALALLDGAPDEGLDAADYGADKLRAALRDPQTDPARFDVALTAATLHYLADLRLGRVRSEYHTAGPDPGQGQFDPVALLDGVVSGDTRLDAAEPSFPLYGRMRAALARYRDMASEPQPVLPQPAGRIGPGGHYPGARKLYARLVLLGDLDAHTPEPQRAVYTAALARGVRRFQARHGLREDGVLGPGTIAALNVPLAQRTRQIALTLERLRWLPELAPGPVVVVNLPSYRLWAFDTAAPDAAPLEMRVIVGTAVKTPTPLFVGQMRYLEFNPYWNVPRSITENEIIPRLEHDPAYLAQHNMELVGAGHADSRVDAAAINLLRAGKLRIRQRPGPRNALGALKFVMPNPMDIYLHSTPQRELFKRTRRDLSHGCIRVERPAELARFVLYDQPDWEPDEIREAMAPGPTRRVALPTPVPVVILYATAVVDAEGRVLFPRDVYRRDPVLEQALAEHSGAGERQKVPASQVLTE